MKFSQQFFRERTNLWENTESLESFEGRAKEFDAIFFVGGGGRMFLRLVLSTDTSLIRLQQLCTT